MRAATSQGRRGVVHSHQAAAATPSQTAAAPHPAIITTWPLGTAAAPWAMRSSRARPSPDPAATRLASQGHSQDNASASTSPGTATPASGIATRFASTPIGATVPNANAVIGAVRIVAATAGATSRTGQADRSAARRAQITDATAVTESHAPTERTDQGSTSITSRAARVMLPAGATTRCRKRVTPASASISAARVAGAGKPSSQTYPRSRTAAAARRGRGPSPVRPSTTPSHAAMNPTCRPEMASRCARPACA